MWSLIKKFISISVVLLLVALILNLKIGGRPARDWAKQVWQHPKVQEVYQKVSNRVQAVLRKDISVEDAFKSNPPIPGKSQAIGSEPLAKKEANHVETRVIELEKLDDEDREALEKILKKSAN